MEKNKEKKEELLSRREFFNKTAKGVLPILGISLFGTTFLTACDPDDHDPGNENGGCSCSNTCSGSCDGSCSGSCDGCSGSCYTTGCTYM